MIWLKTIKVFFKEIFKNDVGEFNREAKKVSVKWKLYWIIGLILGIAIPIGMIIIEWYLILVVFQYELNRYANISYFLLSIMFHICFLRLGYLTTYRINGNRKLLEEKQNLRFWTLFLLILTIALYILTFFDFIT